MTDRPTSPAILGIAGGLVAAGVLLALFGSIVYGIVLVLCGLGLPAFVRRSSE